MNKDTDNVEVNIVYKNRTISVPINITMSICALTALLKSYSITGSYHGYNHNYEYHHYHGYNHYNGYNYGKNNKGKIRVGVVSDHKPPFVLTKFPNEMLLLNFRIKEGDRFYVIFEDDYGIPNTHAHDIHESYKQYEPYKPYKSQKNIYIKTLKRAIIADNHRMVEYILDKELVDLHSNKKLYEKCIKLSKIHSRTYIQNLLEVVAL